MVELVTQPTVILLNPDDSVLKNIAPETVFLGFRQCWLDDLEKFINEDLQDIPQEKRLQFIIDRMEEGHESPIEHACITFLVKNVSRVESHQHVRHRIAGYSQKSQRYVDHQNMRVIVPPTIQKNPVALRVFTGLMDKISEALGELVELGIPKEDARFVLPNATETSLVVTMNLRSLKNFFNERCCSNAQWEIRSVANEMLRQLRERSPLFNHFGPKCLNNGFCKENKKRWCGRAPHIEDVMRNHKEMESLRKENEAKKASPEEHLVPLDFRQTRIWYVYSMSELEALPVIPDVVQFGLLITAAENAPKDAALYVRHKDNNDTWEHLGLWNGALTENMPTVGRISDIEELDGCTELTRLGKVFVLTDHDSPDRGVYTWNDISRNWIKLTVDKEPKPRGSVVLITTVDMELIDMKTIEPGCVYFAQVVRSIASSIEADTLMRGTDIYVLVNPELEWEYIGTMETSALQKLDFNPVQMDSFEELEKVPVDERFLRVFIAPVRDTDDPYSDGEAPIGKFVWDTVNDQWLPVDIVGTITESK